MAGTLYVVATPLGNLEDITLRALRVLKEVALIACEDTRRTRILLTHFGIHVPVTSYFEHNKRLKGTRLLETLQAGQSVALVTDAGTPGISDPGFLLVKQAWEAGIPVVPVPGPSAVVAALSAAGVPADRILAALEAIVQVFGEREIVVAREMTKQFEEIVRGPAAALRERFAAGTARGEFTVIIPFPPPHSIPPTHSLPPVRVGRFFPPPPDVSRILRGHVDPQGPHHRRLGFRRRGGNPGGSQDVLGVPGVRHVGDHRGDGAELARGPGCGEPATRLRGAAAPLRPGGLRRRRGQVRDALDRAHHRSGGGGAHRAPDREAGGGSGHGRQIGRPAAGARRPRGPRRPHPAAGPAGHPQSAGGGGARRDAGRRARGHGRGGPTHPHDGPAVRAREGGPPQGRRDRPALERA